MLASLLALSFCQVAVASCDLVPRLDPEFVETEVAGVLLGDRASGTRFTSTHGKGKVEDDGYIHHKYLSGSASEVLDLVFYPGSVKNTFDKAEVRGASPLDVQRLPRLSLSGFVSRRGIELGRSRDEIVALLGRPQSVAEKDGRVILLYRCDSRKRCPILKRVNMPAYEARYVFQADKLVEFSLGFPYP
jgi:hypothetical protein